MLQGYAEYFCYDALNRLANSAVTYDSDNGNTCTTGDIEKTVAYDGDAIGDGNITGKSDLGVYSYGQNGAGPHAVTSINTTTGAAGGCTLSSCAFDGVANPKMFGACPPAAPCADRGNADGNMLCVTTKSSCDSSAARSYAWTSFNMAASITAAANVTTIGYTPEHDRGVLASGSVTLYYFSNPAAGIADEMVAGTTPSWRTYLRADDGTIKAELFATGSAPTPYYFVGDHLSSTTALTSATKIEPPEEYDPEPALRPAKPDRGDAWGKRRNPGGSDESVCFGLHPESLSLRGYTGQEMLDSYCLVNLNARLYDPALGRVLSADPTVPDATDGQSFNRYSYVENNPLALTDPSGYADDDDSGATPPHIYCISNCLGDPGSYGYGGGGCWGCTGTNFGPYGNASDVSYGMDGLFMAVSNGGGGFGGFGGGNGAYMSSISGSSVTTGGFAVNTGLGVDTDVPANPETGSPETYTVNCVCFWVDTVMGGSFLQWNGEGANGLGTSGGNGVPGRTPGWFVQLEGSIGFAASVAVSNKGEVYVAPGVGTPGVTASVQYSSNVQGVLTAWSVNSSLNNMASSFNMDAASAGAGVGAPSISATWGIDMGSAFDLLNEESDMLLQIHQYGSTGP